MTRPPLVVMSLVDAQAILRQGDVVNTVFLVGSQPVAHRPAGGQAIRPRPTLADLGIALAPAGEQGPLRLTSDRLVIPPEVDRVAEQRVVELHRSDARRELVGDRARDLEVDAQHLLHAADHARLLGRRARGIGEHAARDHAGLRQHLREHAAAAVLTDDADDLDLRLHRAQVRRDVAGAAELLGGHARIEHRDRRLGRDALDIARHVAVEDQVADHEHARAREALEHSLELCSLHSVRFLVAMVAAGRLEDLHVGRDALLERLELRAVAAVAAQAGLLPESVRSFTFARGSIGNTSFVAIPFNAANKEGALVVADFLLDPASQARAEDIRQIGSANVLDASKLAPEQRRLFEALPRHPALPDPSQLGEVQLEPHASWMTRIAAEWGRRTAR